MTSSSQAGSVLESHPAVMVDPKKARAIANWKILIQDLVGLLEAMCLSAFIMTWIFHFTSDQTSVLYSLMQMLLIPTTIFSIIIIPIAYMTWFKPDKLLETNSMRVYARAKNGSNLVLAYVILQVISLLLVVANVIVRVILFFNPLSTVTDVRTVNIALIVLTSVNGLTALLGAIFGLVLMFDLRDIVKKYNVVLEKDKDGNVTNVAIRGNALMTNSTSTSARTRRPRKVEGYTYQEDETSNMGEAALTVSTRSESEMPTHSSAAMLPTATTTTRSSAQANMNLVIPDLKIL